MRSLPPIDAHAHIDVEIEPAEITKLNALVLAVTRTLDEAGNAIRRTDRLAVWGVGCHPGLKKAQQAFEADRFEDLLSQTAFAGELGLDGKSRVPMDRQIETLATALDVLRRSPRLASLHSYAASGQLLDLLDQNPSPGIILHWWLGDVQQTHRAVELGCYFSVNSSSIRRKEILALIPPNKLLTETDHPFGNRRSVSRRPGFVDDVERAIGREHNMNLGEVRQLMWSNFRQLVSSTGCFSMLPYDARVILVANS